MWVRRDLTIGSTTRTYHLYQPDQRPGPYPVVMLLHGAGGTGLWADGETGWSILAEHDGFCLVLPEGSPIDPNKPPKFLTNPQIWNDGSGQWGTRQAELADIDFLGGVLDDLDTQAAIDRTRIYVTGFSNGAGMAFRFAAACGDRLTAVAPVAGHWWLPSPVRRLPPTLYLIGTVDPLIPLLGGRVRNPWGISTIKPSVRDTLARWAQAGGALGPEPIISACAFGVTRWDYPGASVSALLIDGLGHHWPGGKGLLGERLGGPIVPHLNATRAIYRFFAAAPPLDGGRR